MKQLLFLLLIAFLLMSCGTHVAGGAGEVGNPYVVITVASSDGTPVSGSSVFCLEKEFNPLSDSAVTYALGDDNTISTGALAQGEYLITVIDSSNIRAVISEPVILNSNRVDTVHILLQDAASLILQRTSNEDSGVAYIPGTLLTAAVENSQVDFTIAPVGTIPPVRVIDSEGQESIISNEITLTPGEKRYEDLSTQWQLFTNPETDTLSDISYYVATSENRGVVVSAWDKIVSYKDGTWSSISGVELGLSDAVRFYDIGIDSHENIWCATSNGLLKVSLEDHTLYKSDSTGLADDEFYSIEISPDGSEVWAGAASGLVRLKDSLWTTFTHEADGIPDSSISTLAMNRDGQVLVAGRGNGFAIIENDTVVSIPSELAAANIIACEDDGIGRFWLHTSLGAYILDGSILTKGFPGSFDTDTLKITSITRDPETDYMWLAGEKGLYMTDLSIWKHYNQENSAIPSTGVFDLVFSKEGDSSVGYCGVHSGVLMFLEL